MRHAFALAFDLAVRRDPLHSLLVPLAIRLPWILALALLPGPDDSDRPGLVAVVTSVALIGDFLLLLLITAMLRFRARSVFNTAAGTPPAPVLECYGLGVRRLPWLFFTEIARNMVLVAATPFLFLPALFLGFRLSCATEAVVLNAPNLAAAFARSWALTQDRFERWLEMIAASVVIVLTIAFTGTVLSLAVPGPGVQTWGALTYLAVTAVTPVIQYAWTFFYLRLVEVDSREPGPTSAAAPTPSVAEASPGGILVGRGGSELELPTGLGAGTPTRLGRLEPPSRDPGGAAP
jgi:hypothetical protein